jgi:hypothetical protein
MEDAPIISASFFLARFIALAVSLPNLCIEEGLPYRYHTSATGVDAAVSR